MVRNDETNIYSMKDLVSTLVQCSGRDWDTDSGLAFVSDLTGISVDQLCEWMEEEQKSGSGNERYTVCYRLSARYFVDVDAGHPEDAVAIGNDFFTEADFGEASDIDGEAVFVEDSNGRRVWERKKGERK